MLWFTFYNSNNFSHQTTLFLIEIFYTQIVKKRISEGIEAEKIIINHQFSFRQQHEQIHRIVDNVNKDIEERRYCSAAFSEITQAFNKGWHISLFYKLKKYINRYMLSC